MGYTKDVTIKSEVEIMNMSDIELIDALIRLSKYVAYWGEGFDDDEDVIYDTQEIMMKNTLLARLRRK